MTVLIHPIVPAWLAIMDAAGLRPRDVCAASGVAESQFSRWRKGKAWPSRATARRVHRAMGALLGRSEQSVDDLVDKLWIAGGKVSASIFTGGAGDKLGVSPQLIPAVISSPGKAKLLKRGGKLDLSPLSTAQPKH